MRALLGTWVVVGTFSVAAHDARGVVAGQSDTFQTGTTQGWSEGGASPNPPANLATGGPAGAGDRFLQNNSSGGGGAGSRMTMFNTAQWAGNYVSAGVGAIDMDLNNLGATSLRIRLVFEGAAGHATSTTGFLLPAGSGWQHATFDLTSGLTLTSDAGPISAVLQGVTELRINSSSSLSEAGDAIVGSLGVDNITARAVPEPACTGALAVAGIAALCRRRGR